MTTKEKTDALHNKGFNCAQCVLAASSGLTGLPESTALAVAGGFGGGLRSGEVCGAVSGAVMALGMANPYNTEGDAEAKARIAELAKRCVEAFRSEYGAVTCRELLGEAEDRSRCPYFIAFCTELAEKLASE